MTRSRRTVTMKALDHRGTGVWPKQMADLTEEQQRIRDAFMARWLNVLPNRTG